MTGITAIFMEPEMAALMQELKGRLSRKSGGIMSAVNWTTTLKNL